MKTTNRAIPPVTKRRGSLGSFGINNPYINNNKATSISNGNSIPIPIPPSIHLQSSNQKKNQSNNTAKSNERTSVTPRTRYIKPVITKEKEIQEIGGYMLGRTIGEGTFGKVKVGLHQLTGEKVAIKLLEKDRIIEVADVERVKREIMILKRNRHQNVIQLYEVFDTPSTIYLIMEYSDGGELFDYIVENHRIQEPEAICLFHQIVNGLDYIHKKFITHRDLKPENLLLQSTQNGWLVKIVDFGLSNTHENDILLKTACGSPCYAAPEMIEGKKYNGPLADIWSLGVILYAMVCGFLPFEDSNTSVLYKKILSGEYETPAYISYAVKDLIRKILNVNPEKRYTIEDIRNHMWYNCYPSDNSNIFDSFKYQNLSELAMLRLEKLGITNEDVILHVNENSHNSVTATYFLTISYLNRTIKDPNISFSTKTPPALSNIQSDTVEMAETTQEVEMKQESMIDTTSLSDPINRTDVDETNFSLQPHDIITSSSPTENVNGPRRDLVRVYEEKGYQIILEPIHMSKEKDIEPILSESISDIHNKSIDIKEENVFVNLDKTIQSGHEPLILPPIMKQVETDNQTALEIVEKDNITNTPSQESPHSPQTISKEMDKSSFKEFISKTTQNNNPERLRRGSDSGITGILKNGRKKRTNSVDIRPIELNDKDIKDKIDHTFIYSCIETISPLKSLKTDIKSLQSVRPFESNINKSERESNRTENDTTSFRDIPYHININQKNNALESETKCIEIIGKNDKQNGILEIFNVSNRTNSKTTSSKNSSNDKDSKESIKSEGARPPTSVKSKTKGTGTIRRLLFHEKKKT